MQNHHNLVYREEEREMFPTLKVRTYQTNDEHSDIQRFIIDLAFWRRRYSMVSPCSWTSYTPPFRSEHQTGLD